MNTIEPTDQLHFDFDPIRIGDIVLHKQLQIAAEVTDISSDGTSLKLCSLSEYVPKDSVKRDFQLWEARCYAGIKK